MSVVNIRGPAHAFNVIPNIYGKTFCPLYRLYIQ